MYVGFCFQCCIMLCFFLQLFIHFIHFCIQFLKFVMFVLSYCLMTLNTLVSKTFLVVKIIFFPIILQHGLQNMYGPLLGDRYVSSHKSLLF